MALTLPRFIALEWLGRYLQYEKEEGQFHRRVRLSSSMVASEGVFTRFEVVGSSNPSNRNMVHIRTTFNNKFIRLESDRSGSNWLVATADEVEEDRTKWSCTLFRYVYVNNTLGLFHLSRNAERPVSVSSDSSLIVTTSSTPLYLRVVDLQILVILPKHVSFIGDNNMYLSSQYIRLRNRLMFSSRDQLDQTVHFEATTLNNGDVQLRSTTFDGQLWRKSNPEWIWCDTRDTNDRDTIFRPIRVNIEGNTLRLLSVSNNKFCMRWIRGGQPRLIDTLTASSPASIVDPLAEMSIQEAIRDRRIYDIRYRIDEARIYNVNPLFFVPQTTNNFSYTETSINTLGYSYEKVTQETFSSSHSWKVSYSATINVTIIPVFVRGTVEYNAHYEGEVKWSEMNEERKTVSTSVQVPVPPRTRSVVTMVIGRGSIDVPYSYTQRDVLINGTHETRIFDDGLFVGLNTDVFHYDIREEELPDDDSSSSLDKDKKMVVRRHYILKPERAPTATLLPSKEEAEARAVVSCKL